jgi:NDP-sugar pyrophosphorylase family protein
MRPLSDATHKALLPVGGTTILGRIIGSLVALQVRDIVVVTGYRDDDVRAFCARHHSDATTSSRRRWRSAKPRSTPTCW